MTSPFRIGIDLGGTKIELAALDASGRMLLRRRVATPTGDYEGTVESVGTLVDGAEGELGGRGTVGVATPGALSLVDGRVKNANSTWLNGRALKQDLERRLVREVRIANDANCFALSEATDGAARDLDIVFGVILGTGVGGGIVVSRHALAGANAIAGEWGHNPLPSPEPADLPLPACYCGRRGCVETFLSGPGLAADHARVAGGQLTVEEIAARAQAHDAACEATLGRYERAPRPRARRGHQHRRSRCDRPGRRAVEPGAALSQRAAALERARVFRRGAHPPARAPAWGFERGARRGVALAMSVIPWAPARLMSDQHSKGTR